MRHQDHKHCGASVRHDAHFSHNLAAFEVIWMSILTLHQRLEDVVELFSRTVSLQPLLRKLDWNTFPVFRKIVYAVVEGDGI